MDASNTITKQTFLLVVESEVISKDPKTRIYVRWVHPCFRGMKGACVQLEKRTLVTGLFPREGTRC